MIRRHTALIAASDIAILNLSVLIANAIRFGFNLPGKNLAAYIILSAPINVIFLACLYFFGLYDIRRGLAPSDIAYAVFNAVSLASVFVLALSFLFRDLPFPRTVVILTWLTSLVCFSLWRTLLFASKKRIINVVVVGSDPSAQESLRKLDQSGYNILGFVNAEPNPRPAAETLGAIPDLSLILQKREVDEVIVTPGCKAHMAAIIFQCEGFDVRIKVIPELYEVASSQTVIDRMGAPFIELRINPEREGYRHLKRLLDVAASLYALAITFPLFLLAAAAIKLDSPGPIFYTQTRLGRGGREFTLYKFRSMIEDAEAATGPVLESRDDARVTWLGRILRRTYVDELPQLFNVLKGEMSLVGPRPERPVFSDRYTEEIRGWYRRMSVPPGMTGLAQLRGDYVMPPEKKLEYDLYYARNQSLWLDLRILAETILKI